MRLIIIRHGDPDYEKDSLTEKGFREAQLLSNKISKLDVKAFYCSPFGRAKDTAKPTLEKMSRTAETLDWLEEFGGYIIDPKTQKRNIPWDLMPKEWTSNPQFYDKDMWIKTDIMQSGNVEKRYNEVCALFDELLSKHGYTRCGACYKAEKPNKDTIVFFCHFGIECVLLSHLLGVSPIVLWQGFVALPSSVTTLSTEERQEGTAYFRCSSFGDLSHLYVADEEPAFAARFCEIFSDKEQRH